MAERRIPGMAVAVIQHGKVEKIGTYGKASVEFDLPVKPSTPFSVASISQSFTAVAIMTLVEAGKLRLDDPIGSHLRDLPTAWHAVTVRQLLSHTSGLPDISVDDYTSEIVHRLELLPRLEQSLRQLNEVQPVIRVWGLAKLVQMKLLRSMVFFAGPLNRISRWMEPMVSDQGGMFVRLGGIGWDHQPRCITWNLLARQNHGPHIPCGAAIALASKLANSARLPTGATPCMGLLTVEEFLRPLRDLDIHEIVE